MARSAPILVAEDEETDVLLLRIALKKAAVPVELIVARDGQEVVEYLDSGRAPNGSSHPFPGLLLLDLKMPRMGGFEVLEWLGSRAMYKNLPVVIFSSSTHESDIKRAREMGARDYVVKPHDMQNLVGILRELHSKYLTGGGR